MRNVLRPHIEKANLERIARQMAEAQENQGEEKKGKPEVPSSEAGNPVVTPADIDLRGYIQITGHNVVIARNEIFKGQNTYDMLDSLRDSGLKAPKIAQFMDHWLNVKKSALGDGVLYDGLGNAIPKDEAVDLWKYLSSDHRGGCWTLLDAFFKKEGEKTYIITDLKTVRKPGEKPELAGKNFCLEECVMNDCYVVLKFNAQGLPLSEHSSSKYISGGNIFFYYPRDGVVAGFGAGSGRAFLGCNGSPVFTGPQLGVFACAEGTAAKN